MTAKKMLLACFMIVSLVLISGCIGGVDSVDSYEQTTHRNYVDTAVTTNASGDSGVVYIDIPSASYLEKININTGSIVTTTADVEIIDIRGGETVLVLAAGGLTNTTYYPRRIIDNVSGSAQSGNFDKYFITDRMQLTLSTGGATKTGTFRFFYK